MNEAERQEIWFRRAYLSKTLKNIVAEKMNSGEKFTGRQMKMNKLVNEDVPKLLDTVVFLESQVEKQARLAENFHNAYKEKRKVEEHLRKRNERLQKERNNCKGRIVNLILSLQGTQRDLTTCRKERDEWKQRYADVLQEKNHYYKQYRESVNKREEIQNVLKWISQEGTDAQSVGKSRKALKKLVE